MAEGTMQKTDAWAERQARKFANYNERWSMYYSMWVAEFDNGVHKIFYSTWKFIQKLSN